MDDVPEGTVRNIIITIDSYTNNNNTANKSLLLVARCHSGIR